MLSEDPAGSMTRGGRTHVARYAPGSQSRIVMDQKEEIARRLLLSGLSVSQISLQLRCSKPFVRRVRDGLRGESGG